MKKYFILFNSIFLITGLYSQEKLFDVFPVKDNRIFYTNIISVDSTKSSELLKRAKRWAAINCESINLSEEHEIIGKGYVLNNIWYTILIRIKDNKYKYEITDIRERSFSKDYYDTPLEMKKPIIERGTYKVIHQNINQLINTLEKAMQTQIDCDW
jgi:hypothetical protein